MQAKTSETAAAPVMHTRQVGWWSQLRRNLYLSRHYYVLMAPFMLIFFMFTVIPVGISLGLSFFHFNMLEFPRFVGWQNYSRLFLNDDVFLIALKNTLLFAVITGPVSYIACFLFAWIINELSPKVRAVMTLVFYAPSISGNVFFIWLIIFSGDSYGYMNGFLMRLGIVLEPIQWLANEKYVLGIVILVQLWLSLGTSFLAFIAGLQTIDRSLVEAGTVDGIKNRWQELWYITLPSMRPQLMFGAVMQITASFAVAEISIALAGFPSVNYAAHTVVTHLMDYGTIRFEMGYASAIATVLFALMLGTNVLTQKMLRKIGE
ncbi:multiple sugar transport system permease protein [Paenibacillus sp. JGP012]|uniref:ABC transporter permease n=2 Tax=Paenibacillus TaxID=44249 RepID=A0A2W6NN15_9BACL|nr:multiple sugar transport system permease protein [Paenibacillus sp. JGP012]MBU5351580.1 sugar ABC transporter permease [Paenibacillus barcinonensis]MCK6073455.1 sugar ABC transporter permease [Paenibacillus silvae]MCK6149069.1 sugar ABC transporter permease [Paenibacillus silvae]MCK6267368.1 sugar ABC transporter permease [Paenibacillus silvae]